MISFNTTANEEFAIQRILNRVLDSGRSTESRLQLEMSLTACHLNGTPLDLDVMMDWPHDVDLIHDVYGIHKAIDKKTGKLSGIFHPRFAKEG